MVLPALAAASAAALASSVSRARVTTMPGSTTSSVSGRTGSVMVSRSAIRWPPSARAAEEILDRGKQPYDRATHSPPRNLERVTLNTGGVTVAARGDRRRGPVGPVAGERLRERPVGRLPARPRLDRQRGVGR